MKEPVAEPDVTVTPNELYPSAASEIGLGEAAVGIPLPAGVTASEMLRLPEKPPWLASEIVHVSQEPPLAMERLHEVEIVKSGGIGVRLNVGTVFAVPSAATFTVFVCA